MIFFSQNNNNNISQIQIQNQTLIPNYAIRHKFKPKHKTTEIQKKKKKFLNLIFIFAPSKNPYLKIIKNFTLLQVDDSVRVVIYQIKLYLIFLNQTNII